MHRLAPLAAVLLAACNPPFASEKEAFFPTMHDTGEGEYIALFGVTMGVDAATRTELRPELEMNVGGFIPEGASIDAGFLIGLLQPVPTSEPGAHTGEVAIMFEPAFGACEADGYTERDDGGCEVSVVATVSMDVMGGAPRVGFIARVFEPEGYTGSEDAVDIELVVEEAEPEEEDAR